MQLLEQARSLRVLAERYAQSLDLAGEFLQARGINRAAAVTSLLGVVTAEGAAPEHEAYVGRLSIPYLTPAGVTQLRFRSLAGQEPKYLGVPGQSPTMFQVEALSAPGDTIVITEGELDALVMYRECGIPAVGIPGAQVYQEHWWRAFGDFPRVVVMTDGDQAGKELAGKLAGSVRQSKVVHLPDGMDVNDYFVAYGVDAIREKVLV